MKKYLKNQKIEERKTGKSRLVRTIRTISALSIPILAFTALVKIVDDYRSAPVSQTYANLNGDNRKDLIVKTRGGKTYEFVQTEGGKYKLFTPEEKEAMKEQARIDFYLENKVSFSSEDL